MRARGPPRARTPRGARPPWREGRPASEFRARSATPSCDRGPTSWLASRGEIQIRRWRVRELPDDPLLLPAPVHLVREVDRLVIALLERLEVVRLERGHQRIEIVGEPFLDVVGVFRPGDLAEPQQLAHLAKLPGGEGPVGSLRGVEGLPVPSPDLRHQSGEAGLE